MRVIAGFFCRNALLGYKVNKSLLSAVSVAAMVFSASSVWAEDPAPATTPTPAVATAPAAPAATPASDSSSVSDANKIICKSEPPPTGTRLGARRICQTGAQWDAQRLQSQKVLEKSQQMGNMAPMPGG